ncbi:hypothetical protein I6X99_003813 [Vibrio parahaemolyticus]|nr:hypothetical protein [Vibrio parahaemolyticus]
MKLMATAFILFFDKTAINNDKTSLKLSGNEISLVGLSDELVDEINREPPANNEPSLEDIIKQMTNGAVSVIHIAI